MPKIIFQPLMIANPPERLTVFINQSTSINLHPPLNTLPLQNHHHLPRLFCSAEDPPGSDVPGGLVLA